MTDLTVVSRVTRKENSLLQRQLHIKLQILREEYRMTQRILEKHVRDLKNCILSIQHTTPGLGSFRRPDMKSTYAWKQRAEYNNLRITEDVLPQWQLNKSQIEVRSEHEERSVWGCPREEFTGACSPRTMKATEDNWDSMSTSGLVSDSSNSPKYGKAANTVRDETWRLKVLSRFEAIFDLHKEQAKLHTNRPKTSDSSLTDREATDAAKLSEGLSCRRSTRAVQTRLTWSAHSRSKLGSSGAETVPEPLNRKTANDLGLLCAIETSRVQQQTLAPVESAILSSHAPAGQQMLKKLKRPNTAPPKCQLPARAVCVSRQQIAGFHAEIHSRNADIQAILKKSKQLREAVQMLIFEEQTAEVGDWSTHGLSNLAAADTLE